MDRGRVNFRAEGAGVVMRRHLPKREREMALASALEQQIMEKEVRMRQGKWDYVPPKPGDWFDRKQRHRETERSAPVEQHGNSYEQHRHSYDQHVYAPVEQNRHINDQEMYWQREQVPQAQNRVDINIQARREPPRTREIVTQLVIVPMEQPRASSPVAEQKQCCCAHDLATWHKRQQEEFYLLRLDAEYKHLLNSIRESNAFNDELSILEQEMRTRNQQLQNELSRHNRILEDAKYELRQLRSHDY